jgi:hypothetical protein
MSVTILNINAVPSGGAYSAFTGLTWVASKPSLTAISGILDTAFGRYLFVAGNTITGPFLGAPVWPTFTFAGAVLNVSYTQDFDLNPATSPTTYTVQSGALPTGLSLSNVSGDIGRISGTPTVLGSYTFTLRATNTHGTADKSFTISVNAGGGGGSYTFAG